jgi:hypothetical protein
MPTTTVVAPDGREYEIEHPEGALESDIIAYAQQNYGSSEEPEEAADDLREQVGTGATLQFGLPGVTPVFDTGVGMPQWLNEGLAGMGRRFSEIGTLGTHEVPEQAAALLNESVPAAIGGGVADVASLALGGSALRGLGLGNSWAAQALTRPQRLSQAVAGGTAYGAATMPDRLSGGVSGGIGGGIGYGVPNAIGRAVAPRVNPAAQELIDSGGTLTPGEILGGGVQRVEDALTSVPVLGDAIRGAKGRSIADFNRKTINEAIAPVGGVLDDSVEVGRSAIGRAQEIVSDEYGEVLSNMSARIDPQFLAEVDNLKKMARQLPKAYRNRFVREVDDKLLRPFENENKMLLGETFKEIDSGLRTMYKKAQNSSNQFERDYGDALRSAHLSLMDLAKRQNPAMSQRLANADKSYAKLSRIEQASGYEGARDGVFTPSHLLRAIKQNTGKKRYAAGEGFDQASAEGAKGILSQTVPDSGTPIRSIVALGAGGMIDPSIALGALAASTPYTGVWTRAMQRALTSRPEYVGPIRNALDAAAPYASVIGRLWAMEEEEDFR